MKLERKGLNALESIHTWRNQLNLWRSTHNCSGFDVWIALTGRRLSLTFPEILGDQRVVLLAVDTVVKHFQL